MLVHHHLVVRALVKYPPTQTNIIEGWLNAMIKDIGMNVLYGPKAMYSQKEGNAGLTAFAIIDTSHIALHCWDEEDPGVLQLDVYSCAPFELDTILEYISIFDPLHVDHKFLDRTHDFIKDFDRHTL